MLVEKTATIAIDDPVKKESWRGPVINKAAYDKYAKYIDIGRKDGRILAGGEPLRGETYDHVFFVKPTIIAGLPKDHRLAHDEMFLPITCLWEVDSLDEALELANRTEYGLTAGLFSSDDGEIGKFFDRIEAGGGDVHRPARATTGAWPGIDPLG